jgi:hypothetical protein
VYGFAIGIAALASAALPRWSRLALAVFDTSVILLIPFGTMGALPAILLPSVPGSDDRQARY